MDRPAEEGGEEADGEEGEPAEGEGEREGETDEPTEEEEGGGEEGRGDGERETGRACLRVSKADMIFFTLPNMSAGSRSLSHSHFRSHTLSLLTL